MAAAITPKQEKFIAEYIKNPVKVQAALKAYDTDNYGSASAIADQNLKKPAIRERVEVALKSLDVTPEKIIKRFDRQADKYEDINPNAAVRANEQLAAIANLYPTATNTLDIGDGHIKLTWGGTDIAKD